MDWNSDCWTQYWNHKWNGYVVRQIQYQYLHPYVETFISSSVIKADDYEIHPDYDSELLVYDFAIVKLEYSIPFSSIANAACLTTE